MPQGTPTTDTPTQSPTAQERRSRLARAVAALAVLAAVVLLAIVLFFSGGGYEVSAVFPNAGQLVKGNQVDIGGRPVGTIKDISLAPNGGALVKMELTEHSPLHQGTSAVIRVTSLSGIANRYVALEPGPNSAAKIDDGGKIPADKTTAPVDLDQLFNTLDPKTRAGLQQIIKGSAAQYQGRAAQGNLALHYLNPALSTSSRLTRELVVDQTAFQRFVSDTSKTVGALAERKTDLAALVGNANATTRAIGDENVALSRTLGLLPDTLRKGNTTFVNLRAALDDLDPLVNASKPATRRLAPLLTALRPLVADARPTIRDLRVLVNKAGADNDLTDLTRKMPRLQKLTGTVFPNAIKALQKAQPVLEFARPYTPDLSGWFTKFAEGAANYDANGHYARIQPLFNTFQFTSTPTGGVLTPQTNRLAGFQTFKSQRCAGAATQPPPDGSAPYKEGSNNSCDPANTPPGP